MASSFTANQQQQQQQQQHHHHHQHHSQQQQQQHQQQQHHHQHQHHHHMQHMQTPLIHPQHPPQQQLQQPQQHQYQQQPQHHQHQQQQHQQQPHQQQQQQQQQIISQSQASNLAGRELKLIASSFVKQYYTLLNKAPCFIHNFYNQDSTFIHGTIELGTDHTNEPVVGREQIEKKMNELKLNDCRAKIKQIDCLETLAGGLVIQVIGELSNNGRPMRRFLQTFVLAPSPDQPRHEGDQPGQMRSTNDNRRGVQISENSSNSSHNQKFYVLNSIFRYQDDGLDSEFEDDAVTVQASATLESANGHTNDTNNDNHTVKSKPVASAQQQQIHHVSPQDQPQATTTPSIPAVATKQSTAPEVVTNEPKRVDDAVQVSKRGASSSVSTGPSNGNVKTDKKIDTPEKVSIEKEPPASESGGNQSAAPKTSESTPPTVVAQNSVRAPNEPKTWANMVRNALPPSSTNQPSNAAPSKDQQPSPTQAPSNQVNQPNTQQQQQQNENQPNNNNNNNNNRRQRHVIRKPSNKPGSGRTMKNRNPRPQAAPAAPASKPPA